MTSKGQVTIPIEMREAVGLLPDSDVEFELGADCVKIRKASASTRRGKALVQHLRGRGDVRLTTDEILALTRGEA